MQNPVFVMQIGRSAHQQGHCDSTLEDCASGEERLGRQHWRPVTLEASNLRFPFYTWTRRDHWMVHGCVYKLSGTRFHPGSVHDHGSWLHLLPFIWSCNNKLKKFYFLHSCTIVQVDTRIVKTYITLFSLRNMFCIERNGNILVNFDSNYIVHAHVKYFVEHSHNWVHNWGCSRYASQPTVNHAVESD